MSIFGAMRSGVTGLAAQSQSLGMIGDNIANVNTVGFKAIRPRFSTLVTQAGSQSLHSPGGVQSRVAREVDAQGLLQGSSSATDLAVSGSGFFTVNSQEDGSGDIRYTRAGEFRTDKDGNLVNTAGYYLMGWPIVNDVVQSTNVLSAFSMVNVANLTSQPQPTSTLDVGANLPSTATTGDDFTLGIQVFDQQGGGHTLSLTFTKTATANEWTLSATVANALFDDGAAGVAAATLGTVTFGADGTLSAVAANAGITTLNGDDLEFTLDYDSNTATTVDQVGPIALNLGTLAEADGMTQFSGTFAPNFIEQNGSQFGSLTGVTVDKDGIVTALFDNGETRNIYQVPLVTFNNPNGLREESGNVYVETTASGAAVALAAGTGGAGVIAPSTIETSTVDIADEFTRMIITQRAFSASTRVITTADEMLDELVRIIR